MDYFDKCKTECLELFDFVDGYYIPKIINGKKFTFRCFHSNIYKELRELVYFITSSFPNSISIQERVFIILNSSVINTYVYHHCLTCGKQVKFNNITHGYRKFCGNGGCVYKSDEFKNKSRQTMIDRYGVEYPLQSEIFQEKYKKTCLDLYGYENVSQSEGIQDLKRATCIERYGVSHHSKTPEWKTKVKETKLYRYGDEKYTNISLNKQTKLERYGNENYNNRAKSEETCIERYGVRHALQSEEVRHLGRNTKLSKYGDENYNNPIKQQETCFERYGVSSATKLSEIQDKIASTNLKKYGHKSGFFANGCRKYSKISQKLFWNIYNNLPLFLQEKCYFAELNKEFGKFNHNIGRGYFYDFVISNIKFCIEFDGDYWHSKEGSKEIDNEKQLFLENLGFTFIRIQESDYMLNKNVSDDCVHKILNLCSSYLLYR